MYKQLLIVLILLMIIFHEFINRYFVNNNIFEEIDEVEDDKQILFVTKKHWRRIVIFFIPIFIYIYFDTNYNSFSAKSLKLTQYINNDTINYILNVFGAYGVIQIVAQDLGLHTGIVQRDLAQTKSVQFMLFFGTSYALTSNRSQAFIATIVYFILKYNVSAGKTSHVCFENV